MDDDLEDFIVKDEDEEGEESEDEGAEEEDEDDTPPPGHRRDRSVLHKYRRLLEEEDADSAGPSGTGEDEDGEEGEEQEEDEEDEEEEEVAGTGADVGGGNPSRQLWCTLCGRSRHPDDFSDRQRRHGTDEDRYCLFHTGESLEH